MNKVFLRGNLTRDVESHSTQSGKVVSRFSIAVRRDFKNEEGNYDADFINCVAFGYVAETISKYFHKGSGIIVLGHIQTGSYENDEGYTVRTTDVIVESIEFDRKVETKKEDKEEITDAEIVAKAMSNDPFRNMGEQIEIDSNELPF